MGEGVPAVGRPRSAASLLRVAAATWPLAGGADNAASGTGRRGISGLRSAANVHLIFIGWRQHAVLGQGMAVISAALTHLPAYCYRYRYTSTDEGNDGAASGVGWLH